MKLVYELIFLVLSCCFIKHSDQRHEGAPATACTTLLPNHNGNMPQTDVSPYTLTATILLNGNVNVKIHGNNDQTFAGFLIQGRQLGGDTSLGSFITDDENYQTVTCVTTADSATHNDAMVKTELDLIWVPPIGFTDGEIYFTGTVLQAYALYWGDIRSNTLYITEDTIERDEIYQLCDSARKCYGSPTGCVITQNCDTIAVVHLNNGGFHFELKTWPGVDLLKPQYVAFGISNGRSMIDISVIECVVGEDDQISAYTSYTEVTGTERGSPRTDVPQSIIKLISSLYIDDVIHCVVERDTVTVVHDKEYNLLDDKFYVHLAVGSSLLQNQVGPHDLTLTTTEELDFVHVIEAVVDPIYDNCDGSRVCFGAPLECIARRNCEAVAVVHYTDDKFKFELKTLMVSETLLPAYIAFGISDEPSMADISVIECTVESTDIIHAYISQTQITESHSAPRHDISQNMVRLIQSEYVDGMIHCVIERDNITTVHEREYNLLNEQYYIHIAIGSELRENSVSVHDLIRVTSPEKVSFYNGIPGEVHSIYDGCTVTKGCFGHPPDCVGTSDCLTVTAINFVNNVFQFEMVATNEYTPQYAAFGLSTTPGMGDASVIECVVENGAINVYTSYTEISPMGSPRTDIPQNIVRLVSGSYIDGAIHCVVERDTISEVRGQTFDLMNDEYYLLVASGSSVRADSIEQHDRGRLMTGSQQSLRDLTFAAASNTSIKIHGIFMIVAWVGTSAIGIVLARYFKKTWVGNQMCGKDQWFAWHRICMISTGLLTITAFIVIFVEIDDWSAENNPHAILGTIVTGICLLQIVGGLFRPAPDAKHRVYFNWGHMLGGSAGQILAIITIFFSVTLTKAELTDEFYWVMGVFCIFYVVMYTLFHTMLLMGEKQHHKQNGEAPFSFIRKMMLGFFIIVTVLFVVALSVLIGLAPL